MKDFSFLDVIINLPLDSLYTYKTNLKTKIGSIVKVPFGNNNEITDAVVISAPYTAKRNYYIKKIVSVKSYEGLFSFSQIQLLLWASEYYLVSLPKILNSLFSKKIFNFKNLEEKNKKINSQLVKKTNNINLIIGYNKDLKKHINDNVEINKKTSAQHLILSPNSYQCQGVYNELSKKIKEITYIYDSKTSPIDKLEIWRRVINNKNIVIIGIKSAVFLPFTKLNKIIVINEHDFLYKETDRVIRYNARDCAIMLSKINKCEIDLISDSPSIESMYNCQKGKFIFHDKMKKLSLKTDLSKISIVNKTNKKLKGLLTEDVINQIKESLTKNEKIIIYTPYSKDIEPIESFINSFFNKIKLISSAKSSSMSRNQLIKFYLDINKNNIIIGNHSVIDSIETFNYNLLVLINPDKIFSNTNYKSNEIYFQILFKLFKKVKNEKNKKLLIQLSNSDYGNLNDNIRLNYNNIIKKEMVERKVFDYPPYKRLICLELNGKNISELELKGKKLNEEVTRKFKFCNVSDIGLVKNKKKIIYKIFLKLDRIKNLKRNKKTIYDEVRKIKSRKSFHKYLLTIDIDP